MLYSLKRKLKEYHILPSKGLGQTFLIDKKVVKKVIKAAALQKKDTVLEIGPGLGSLTKEIAEKVRKVIAIEKDRKMCEILKKILKGLPNIEIINEDILRYKLQATSYKIIANLPFYIATPVIRKFLESKKPPKEMILIIQKEVAQKICARPPKTNFLAIAVQSYSKPKILGYISKKSFWPQPKIDSAIIKIVPRLHPAFSGKHGGQARQLRIPVSPRSRLQRYSQCGQVRDKFFRIVRAGFSYPRKQLASNLSNELKLNKKKINSLLIKNNIQPSQRAETLTIQDWIKLAKVLK